MAVDIEYIKKRYIYKNLPVPYDLKCGVKIEIYPIKVKDWDIFEESSDILNIDKNDIPVPEIIQMSYLQFIVEVAFGDDKSNISKFYNIMKMSLHEDDIKIGYENNKPVLIICEKNMVKSKITHKDFDDIKKIILYQNYINYDDEYVSKDMRNVINEYYRTINGDFQPLSLEDKMAFLGNETGLTYNQMLDMTHREFSNRFNWAVDRMDYQINKTAEMSGNVKFKKELEHLIYKNKKNKFEKFFTDKDSFVDKINNVNK